MNHTHPDLLDLSGTQTLPTPFYLLDENRILKNLERIKQLCDLSGAKALLALKCFATWGVFEAMKPYLHGTTSSSLHEVRLGKECFGGETHAYSVAYAPSEIDEVLSYADKVIFNSFNQLAAFGDKASALGIPVGIRINPKTSNSSSIIADPARPFSRLGEHDAERLWAIKDQITGVMIHYNCENDDFDAFSASLAIIEDKFGKLFHELDWVSLGGGIHFIDDNYPLDALAARLRSFAEQYNVQVYLEPGEASIHKGAVLVTTVLDTLHNERPLAVVDASTEAHMLDLLIYQESAPFVQHQDTYYPSQTKQHRTDTTIIYGKSCLAGDIFGDYDLPKLHIGDRVCFGNAAGYTMVKKNWFNGVAMPSIVIRRTDGSVHTQRSFGYEDYKSSLS